MGKGSGDGILGANWFAKLYSAMCAMDSRFRGNDSAGFVANHFRESIKEFLYGMLYIDNLVMKSFFGE